MKSYRWFIAILSVLLVLYILAEVNRPQPVSWRLTLSKDDKNPYGAYILYNRMKDVFPRSEIISLREPAYNLLRDNSVTNAAYFIIAPRFGGGEQDIHELLRFAEQGNYVFLSAGNTTKLLLDTLGIEEDRYYPLFYKDSTGLNFVTPSLRTDTNFRFRKLHVDEYFSQLSKKDSSSILGITHRSDPNFVRVDVGEGAFFIHAAPLCFSNYFLLFENNHDYVSRALSYIPADVGTIYWDEYYKLGRTGATTPLRVFLNDPWLRWALWLTVISLVAYVLFGMKRRQRIIPVIEPLRNTTLDFVKTVSAVYLSQKDNRSIANNKIQYWLHYIRRRYYLQTKELNDEFVSVLAKRSGSTEEQVQAIVNMTTEIQGSHTVTDPMLLELNRRIDNFYISSKT